MRRMKQFLVGLLAVLSIFAGLLGLVACDENGDQGVGIEKVGFDENGDLLITFTDGTKQTVTMPEKEEHVHTFGDWTEFTSKNTYCEQKLFLRTCSTCHGIEWKQGIYEDHNWNIATTAPTCQAQGYDTKICKICGKVERTNITEKVEHAWLENRSYDDVYHWFDCDTCDEVKEKQEHNVGDSGECSICKEPVGATAGISYKVVDGEAQVVAYKGNATNVRIGETYNGAPVTKIVNKAFDNCSRLASIVIPDSVTSIGDYAFYDCSSLTSVYITDIEAWCNIAFDDYYANPLCYAKNLYLNNELVTELEITGSVTSIGEYAFYNCDSLTSIVIPDSVTSIGSSTFEYCSSLTSVTIPDSVTSIGDYAFYKCNRLERIVIPDSVTSIGSSTFEYCSSLTSVTIPESVTSIGNAAFYNCDSLTSVYISSIEVWCNISGLFNLMYSGSTSKNLYLNNELVTELEIPNTVTEIKDCAFRGCGSLTSIEIPDSVTSIGGSAFSSCSSLTSIEIPDSVTSIGYRAFHNCDSLQFNEYGNAKYLGGKTNNYFALIEGISIDLNKCIVHSDTKIIADYAFFDYSSLTSLVIGDNVNSIGYSAFAHCSNLTSVAIPDSVTTIDGGAFEYCSSLTSLVIGDSVNSIGYSAFAHCSNLTSVAIPDSVTTIDGGAFEGCSSLTSLVIGDSVNSIGYSAFAHCSNLTSVAIPDSVTTIDGGAFEGCSSLTNVMFEDTDTWYRTTSYTNFVNQTGGTQMNVSNSSTNANNLKSDYGYYWYKK